MKVRLITVLAVLGLLVAAIVPSVAFAAAYGTSFTTSITYQNVGGATASVQVLFYDSPSDTTATTIDLGTLAAGAGASIYIGSLADISAGFRGTAIMQSDQPLLATLVQVPVGSPDVRNRPLSNGFSNGSGQMLIATVLKNTFETNTIFSVQNVDSVPVDVTIHFYNTSAVEVDTIGPQTIQPGAGFYVDAGAAGTLSPASLNGSAVVESTGQIVASAMELSTTGTAASAFEGVGEGSTTYYMPSALCNYSGSNTAYAVQNTSLSTSTNVTVTYSNGSTDTKPIGPGAKASFIACNAAGVPDNFLGAATVTSDTTDVIAIGKAYGAGLSTAFVGESTGFYRLSLPYVRWAANADWLSGTNQRTFITIQNVGADTIPANSITVRYIDRDGNTAGTHTIATDLASGAKANSNASMAGLSEFGYYHPGFGGAAIVESSDNTDRLAVVGRVASYIGGQFVGEDTNGMPVP